MRTLREAKALLDERGLVTLSEYVEAIAGEKPKGSWWSHPKGKLIFNVTSALEEQPGVIVCKLIEGRVTFVSERMVPMLLAVATDSVWRKARIAELSSPAKRLLSRVLSSVEGGELEITAKTKKPAAELAACLLVRAESRHMPSGRHATFLVAWRKVRGLPAFSRATAVLAEHGVDGTHLGRNLVESTP